MSIGICFDSDYNTELMYGENETLRKILQEIYDDNESLAQEYFRLSTKRSSTEAFALYNRATGLREANCAIDRILNKYNMNHIIRKE